MAKSPTPTIGRIVGFVQPNGPHAGETRAAIITRVLPDERVNLQVMLDGPNDQGCTAWVGTISQDQAGKAKGTWHWFDSQLAK